MQLATLTNFVKTKKPQALIIFVLLVVLVAGSFFVLKYGIGQNNPFSRNKNIIFVIDGKNYTKADIEKLISYPVSRHTPKNVAAKEAFDALKAAKAAQNLGYTPSNSEVKAQKDLIYSALKISATQQSQYNDWFTLMATQSAINVFVNAPTPLGYAGYSYVFFFGQHLQSAPDYKPSGLNDPKLVAQDQAYAKQKADYYHQQLQDNTMTPAEALSKSIVDMQSRGHGVSNPNFSAGFTGEQSLNTAVYMSDIISYITGQGKTGLSDVKTGKALTAPTKSHGKSIDMYYYFVDLTAVPASKAISPAQFNQALGKLTAQYRGFAS